MTKIKKHPLSITWEKWLKSKKGESCSDPSTLKIPMSQNKQFLENRLYWAFQAGAEAQREIDKKIIRLLQRDW